MNVIEVTGLFASVSAVFAAIVNGILTMTNTGRINKNAGDVEELKGAMNRDIEKLKAKLVHGQLVNSTQWNAEFNAYQELWRSVVLVRGLALKLVRRAAELAALGVEEGDVSEADRIEIKIQLLKRYSEALRDNMLAINGHAPFYVEGVRRAANAINEQGNSLRARHLSAIVAVKKGQSEADSETALSNPESSTEIKTLLLNIDELESLIRKRLNEVRVIS